MSQGKNDFQARLAKIADKQSDQPLAVQDALRSRSTSRPLSRPLADRPSGSPAVQFLLPLLGLVFLAGLVVWAWPELETMFVAGDDPLRQGSYLERSLLERMSDEEISRMNSDPAMVGKSQMERLILSN